MVARWWFTICFRLAVPSSDDIREFRAVIFGRARFIERFVTRLERPPTNWRAITRQGEGRGEHSRGPRRIFLRERGLGDNCDTPWHDTKKRFSIAGAKARETFPIVRNCTSELVSSLQATRSGHRRANKKASGRRARRGHQSGAVYSNARNRTSREYKDNVRAFSGKPRRRREREDASAIC